MQLVYQDPSLAVIVKPAGIPSLPERGGNTEITVLSWVRQHLHPEANLLHRLDKPTSGLLTVSWNPGAFRKLYAQFSQHQVEKKYWALVQGEADFVEAELTAPLRANPPRVDPFQGKPALTFAHTLERYRGYSLVVCVPATGRIHQVRLHLSYYGFPIVGDKLYGGEPLYLSRFHPRYKPPRQGEERPLHGSEVIFLHAGYLRFMHPLEGYPITCEAELPDHFQVALRQLRKWAGRRT